jgi:CysZ protein
MVGLRSYFSGMALIFKPGVRRFVWIPFVINLLLFSLASWLLWTYMSSMLDSLLPTWLDWLSWLLMPLFSIMTLLLVYLSFSLLANIIAAPFYVYLARGVERHLSGELNEPSNNNSVIKEALSIMGLELRKLTYYLVRAIPLLILSIIPGINIISLPMWLLFSAWFLTFEYMGYFFENHQVMFKEQKTHMQSDRVNHIVFGSISLFAVSVPIFNLFSPAIGVAGATKMLVETKRY